MIIVGLLLFAAGFAWMTVADVDTTFWTLVGDDHGLAAGPGASSTPASTPPR